MTHIPATRFGTVQVPSDLSKTLIFPQGILGFDHLRGFALIKPQNDDLFVYMQSLESPAVAFPLVPERLFKPMRPDGILAVCIVTVPNDPMLMTANLKAPVLIGRESREGLQFIEQEALAIRHPCFDSIRYAVEQEAMPELWRPFKSLLVETSEVEL